MLYSFSCIAWFLFVKNVARLDLTEGSIILQLFEMGLELSLARLKALAKFAFGMGLTQVFCHKFF